MDTIISVNVFGTDLTQGDFKVSPEVITEKGLSYLLAYGFRQSVQDCIAGKAKELREEIVSDDDAAKLGLEPGSRRYNDAEIASQLRDIQQARVAAIIDGTIADGRTGAPRMTKLESIMNAVAVERLRAKLAKFKLALPSGKNKDGSDKTIRVNGKDATRDMLITAELNGKNKDGVPNMIAIKAEAEHRMAVATASASADLDIEV